MAVNPNMEGIDKVGYVYSKQAVIMAQALDLFKKPKMEDQKTKTVYTFTAWAVFCWQSGLYLSLPSAAIATRPSRSSSTGPIDRCRMVW